MLNLVSKDHGFRRGFSWRYETGWLIFHHVGPMPGYEVNADVIHGWHRKRKTKSGTYWNGIGYQFVVLLDGTIEKGRPVNAVGAHTLGLNSVSIGVCVVGNFEECRPTVGQIRTCINIGRWAIQEIDQDIRIGGHYNFADTACPGQYFPLKDIRRQAKEGRPVSKDEELTWQQKQAIRKVQELADMGFLYNPESHIEDIKAGRPLHDAVTISLIARIAKERGAC